MVVVGALAPDLLRSRRSICQVEMEVMAAGGTSKWLSVTEEQKTGEAEKEEELEEKQEEREKERG